MIVLTRIFSYLFFAFFISLGTANASQSKCIFTLSKLGGEQPVQYIVADQTAKIHVRVSVNHKDGNKTSKDLRTSARINADGAVFWEDIWPKVDQVFQEKVQEEALSQCRQNKFEQ